MHYIRLLRPPKLAPSQRGMHTELVFTITTDLGDSFLCPEEPIDLVVTADIYAPSGGVSCELSERGKLQWLPGRRVAKPVYELPLTAVSAMRSGDAVDLCISTASSFSADGVESILSSSAGNPSKGLVMPVRVALNGPEAANGISTRKLRLSAAGEPPEHLEVEEEIGESIARHVWDAGVVALAAIAGVYRFPRLASSRHPCMQALWSMFDGGAAMNILELGCGVGILGTGLGAVYPRGGGGDCTILLTDLDEAAGRARANMALLQHSRANMLYENLDWDDGRQGRFGRLVRRRRWDLVVLSDCTYNADALPALVGTLSALHASNAARAAGDGDAPGSTRVFLATKPRHASERALFDLMAGDGWRTLETQVLPLPVLGGESEAVEMYLFEKA